MVPYVFRQFLEQLWEQTNDAAVGKGDERSDSEDCKSAYDTE